MDIIEEKAQQWYDAGILHMDAQPARLSAALACFSHALFLKPTAILYQHRGECFVRLCDFQAAISNLSHALHLSPTSPQLLLRLSQLHYLQSRIYHDDHQVEEAMCAIEQAVKLQPENTDFWILRIKILITAKRYGLVLNELTQFITLNPIPHPTPSSSPPSTALTVVPSPSYTTMTSIPLSTHRLIQALLLRAKLYMLLSRVDLALTDITHLFHLAPNNKHVKLLIEGLAVRGETLYSNAIAHILAGHTNDAILDLTKALELTPHIPSLYKLRASLYRQCHRYDESLQDLKMGVAVLIAQKKKRREEEKQMPDDFSTQTFMSEVRLSEEEDKDEEMYDFEYQLSLTYTSLALDYISQSSYSLALTCLNHALALCDNSAMVYRYRGDIYACDRQWALALTDYMHAHTLLSNHRQREELHEQQCKEEQLILKAKMAKVHNEVGKILHNNGNYKVADVELTKSITYDPTVGDYYFNRSRNYFKLTLYEQAYKDAERSVQLDPTAQQARQFLLQLRQILLRPSDQAKLQPLPQVATHHTHQQAHRGGGKETRAPGQSILDMIYPSGHDHNAGVKLKKHPHNPNYMKSTKI